METTKDAIIPAKLFSNILPNLITVLECTQMSEGVVTPQARQGLLQATNELRGMLAQANEYAISLPGGELNSQGQGELLAILEKLRNHKWQELEYFVAELTSNVTSNQVNTKMEVDSTASTPPGF